MNPVHKLYFPGLDLLKFILALLIVSGHCQLFIEIPDFQIWWSHFTSIAVPLFFGISSFLFFRKTYSISEGKDTRSILIHSVRRLILLFACWYVLMMPMIYFQFFSVANLKEVIFAFLLSCSLRGYWFIKALIINTIIVYLCRKKKTLVICSFWALVVYLYCSYNYIYHYNPFLESLHPYYSFYYHTISFCIGALIAKTKCRIKNPIYLLLIWLCSLFLCYYEWMDPIFRIISILLILPLFIRLHINKISSESLRSMRSMSIILYMVQFLLIWLYDGGCRLFLNESSEFFRCSQLSIIRFIVVLSLAIGISLFILKNEPKYKWLKYLH